MIKVIFEIFHNDVMLIKRSIILLLRLLSSFVHFEVLSKRDLTKLLVDLKSLESYKVI